MDKEERYNYVFDQYDGDSFIYDLKKDKRIDDLSQCAYILNEYETILAESEKLGKRMYEQKEYAEKILRMSTHEETKEICKLKQQLEEKDQAIESLQEINQSLGQTCNNDAKEIDRLREQLSEKDGELHQIYSHLGVEAFGEDIHEQALKEIAEKEKENSVLKAVIDKNKTGQFGAVNFCNAINEFYEPLVKDMIIAELEKVKEYNKGLVYSSSLIDNFIDQQIKSLKGDDV